MSKFKIGDKVKVYDICQVSHIITEDTGIIEHQNKDGALLVKMNTWGTPPHNAYYFHPKQCRKLVKKKQQEPGYLQYNDGRKTKICCGSEIETHMPDCITSKETIKLPKKSSEWSDSPITRERYRQIKLKMKRQAKRIRRLETQTDEIYQVILKVMESGKKGDGTTTECDMIYQLDELIKQLEKNNYNIYE